MKMQNNINLKLNTSHTVPIRKNSSSMSRQIVYEIASRRFYSTSSSGSGSPFNQSPITVLTLSNLND